MSRIIQWTNANRYRRYPLVDDASYEVYRIDEGVISNYTFSNDVLLDFSFTTYIHNAPTVRLLYFTITNDPPGPANCRFTLSVTSPGAPEELVWITVPVNVTFPYSISSVVPGSYRLSCVLGEGLIELCNWTTHRYYFKYPPVILPSCVVAMNKHRIAGIRGSTVDSIQLLGDVYVEEGYNVALTVSPEDNTLTIGAQLGAGKGVSCDVLPNARKPIDGIILINELLPDPSGNINILKGPGIDINQFDEHTLQVKATVDDNRIVCKQ